MTEFNFQGWSSSMWDVVIMSPWELVQTYVLKGEQVSFLVWIQNFFKKQATSQTFSSFKIPFLKILQGFFVRTLNFLLTVVSQKIWKIIEQVWNKKEQVD